MAKDSQISWTDHTWNVVLGCDRVSAGCDNCYAITNARIRENHPNPKVSGPYQGLVEHRDGRLDWTGKVRFVEDRLAAPLHWRKPARIFVNAQSDLFHKAVTDEQIARVWAVMALSPQHTFQILTKRPARMRALLSTPAFHWKVWHAILDTTHAEAMAMSESVSAHFAHGAGPAVAEHAVRPLRNVWLGTSVEDQKAADLRIPTLLRTPAAVRFLSCEPLLGPVDLSDWLTGLGPCTTCDGQGSVPVPGGGAACPACNFDDRMNKGPSPIGWVIAGGESGPGARPMHPDWARGLRDQCDHAGVAFHFKQQGEWGWVEPDTWENRRESDWLVTATGFHYPITEPGPWSTDEDQTIRRVGKKKAGRLLDGRTHDEYPEVSA